MKNYFLISKFSKEFFLFTVTFYSFKGGVGTFALMNVALDLVGKERRLHHCS